MVFSTKESKVDTKFQTTFFLKQYRIIAQNTAEDMCDWQSKIFLKPSPNSHWKH